MMTNPRAEIWNVLHDGEISGIEGQVPGAVDMRIQIAYLRQMFPGDGECIDIRLHGCRAFSMNVWEDDERTDNLHRIALIRTEILSTESEDIPVHVVTTLGEIVIDFESFSLRLDDGRGISFSELCTACETYWDRWEREAREARNRTNGCA